MYQFDLYERIYTLIVQISDQGIRECQVILGANGGIQGVSVGSIGEIFLGKGVRVMCLGLGLGLGVGARGQSSYVIANLLGSWRAKPGREITTHFSFTTDEFFFSHSWWFWTISQIWEMNVYA